MFVPQHHPYGAQAEADFYHAAIDFPWGRETAHNIALRSEYSAARLHTAYPQESQAALLEGLEKGFHFLGESSRYCAWITCPLQTGQCAGVPL